MIIRLNLSRNFQKHSQAKESLSEKKSKYLLRTVENQNTIEERLILVEKMNSPSPLRETKINKILNPNQDQKFAQKVHNISKNPSRTDKSQSHLQNKSRLEDNFI